MTGRPAKDECDGSWQDYKRHWRAGEPPCPESKRAWAEYVNANRNRLAQGEYADRPFNTSIRRRGAPWKPAFLKKRYRRIEGWVTCRHHRTIHPADKYDTCRKTDHRPVYMHATGPALEEFGPR